MKRQLKILLILSLFFILLLFFISSKISPKITPISQIHSSYLGKTIKLNSTISLVREFPESSFQIFLLKDATGNITAITFSNKALILKKDAYYLITGKIQDYNNTLQVNVNKIILP
jgi:DNA/RNA endonuclease YhcR with UshA esterase domain